jgi:hypothetical protein|tara:strand:+ start:406 stop:633 length:228 start_codon:yes stop_codon:yes gene_type:complete
MIITDQKENEVIINLLKIVADDCNLYWHDENDVDKHNGTEWGNYLKLKDKLNLYMNEDDLKDVDLMKILYRFKQI